MGKNKDNMEASTKNALKLIDQKFAALLEILRSHCHDVSLQPDVQKQVFRIIAANRQLKTMTPQVCPALLHQQLTEIEGSLHASVEKGKMPEDAKLVRAFCILLSRAAWEIYGSKEKFGQLDPQLHSLLHMHEKQAELPATTHPTKARREAEQHQTAKGIIAHFRDLPQEGLALENWRPNLRQDLGAFGQRFEAEAICKSILSHRFEQLSRQAAQKQPPVSSGKISAPIVLQV